jgi:hypothetical protein
MPAEAARRSAHAATPAARRHAARRHAARRHAARAEDLRGLLRAALPAGGFAERLPDTEVGIWHKGAARPVR